LEDAGDIHKLITTTFLNAIADKQRWLAHWNWVGWNNPYRNNRPVGWVAEHQGRIVGYIGCVHLPLLIAGQKHIGAIPAGFCVAPDAASQGGVFTGLQLAQAFCDDAKDAGFVVMATTANEKTATIFSRFDCKTVAWTKELWRVPVNIKQKIRTYKGSNNRIIRRILNSPMGNTIMNASAWIYQIFNQEPSIPLPGKCAIEEHMVMEVLDDLSHLHEILNSNHESEINPPGNTHADNYEPSGFFVERSAKYLSWRYAQHPQSDQIRVILLRDKHGQLIGGTVVFLEILSNSHVAYVEELIFPSRCLNIAKTLLCAALQLASNLNADYLVTSSGRLAYRPIFWELGFESRARSAPAAVIQRSFMSNENNSIVPLSEHLDDSLQLWHGEMF